MAGIPIVLVGVGRLPVVMAEVRLRQCDQHAGVICRLENLGEAQMRTWFATVVVSVNQVDADALEPFQRFARGLVGGKGRPNLRVIEWNSGEMDARTIKKKIPSLDPKLTEAKARRPVYIKGLAGSVQQREFQAVHVLRRM